ncbi:MAG: thiol peroxidase [Desulfobulbaceae bacterium]|nr:thiol peroxidase [Desulfobulbaceae bacterium]
MARTSFKGNPVETEGDLPKIGSQAPDFKLTNTDLSDVVVGDYLGRRIVMNIFPSIDTPVCANSVRRFNKEASEGSDTVVLCISADLPFAHQRFCEVEGLKNVIPLSVFRNPEFGRDYGLTIAGGALVGLLARAVIILDDAGKIGYCQLVQDIAQEPDYETAIQYLAP